LPAVEVGSRSAALVGVITITCGNWQIVGDQHPNNIETKIAQVLSSNITIIEL